MAFSLGILSHTNQEEWLIAPSGLRYCFPHYVFLQVFVLRNYLFKTCPTYPIKKYISNAILFFMTIKICFSQFLLVLYVRINS